MRWAWMLLLALSLVQAKLAVAGCLVHDTWWLAAPSAAAASHATPSADCCPDAGGVATKRCAELCKPTANAARLCADHAAVAVAPIVVVPVSMSSMRSVYVRLGTYVRLGADPPAFLRYLRLLN